MGLQGIQHIHQLKNFITPKAKMGLQGIQHIHQLKNFITPKAKKCTISREVVHFFVLGGTSKC
ncbi:hypothetical protein DPQ31_17120 [Bacillus sp. COPE52]|nr:hypothetical protein DPQ31_17120 [Bacillus sp. COPE52]